MLFFMTPFYILIAMLTLVAYVAVKTLIHNERKHAEQREHQRAKWRARREEVCKT